ncbi:MAG TPA: flagellar basal body rod protein FlgC [Candidatus Binataceae bacterium]|nr:flagellar basal body rod protein FlgC [Candidatus Binataceae bacterium]
MSIEAIFGIANSALDAQSERITLVAENLANANSVETPQGGPYQRQMPVFQPAVVGEDNSAGLGVKLAAVISDPSPPKTVYDPSNPFADAEGMVAQPSVDPIYEMVDLMQASRSYQANLAMVQTAKSDALNTINLLK